LPAALARSICWIFRKKGDAFDDMENLKPLIASIVRTLEALGGPA
jgi:hypothetical protein